MLHIRFIILTICMFAFSAVKSVANTHTFADIRENVIKLADGLKLQYDTVYVVVNTDEEYVILTDSVLYEKDEFDGFSIFTARYKSDSTFVLKEVDPEKCSFNFSRNIIIELLRTKPKDERNSWIDWEFHRSYCAILIDGKIVYEYFVPQCSHIGEPKIEYVAAQLMTGISVINGLSRGDDDSR